MPYPSINQLENRIKDNMLIIDDALITHPAFRMLLKALGQTSLSFSMPKINSEEDTKNIIIIEGESTFFSNPLNKADLYIYEEPESEEKYEFEWHGTLKATSFDDLYKDGIITPAPMNVIPELLNGIFDEVDLLFTSADKAFAIEVRSSGIKFELPEVGFSLDKIGFYYERSLDQSIDTKYRLYSTIQIGSTSIPTAIELPVGSTLDPVCWSLKITDVIILNNGLKDIIGFLSGQEAMNAALGKDLLTLLPEAVAQIPAFALTDLVIHFNPKTKFLQLVDFSIQSLQKFELVPGFSLHHIGVSAFITFLDGEISCTLELFGQFSFTDAIKVGISVKLPLDLTGDWLIEMNGSADLEQMQDLDALPFIKLSDLNIPTEWLTVRNIQMDTLRLTFNPAEAKIKTVYFSLRLYAESSLIPGITVRDPHLEFDITLN